MTEACLHCAKAMMRSGLRSADAQVERQAGFFGMVPARGLAIPQAKPDRFGQCNIRPKGDHRSANIRHDYGWQQVHAAC